MQIGTGGFGFQWHVTGRCAGRCAHCYQSDANGAVELPLDALKRVADEIMGAVPGPVTVNVTGGEPLMYRGGGSDRAVFELMAYLSRFNNLGELNVITSASGMDRRAIRDLKALPKLSYVKVSLESRDPAVNDGIRWPGHHAMALENMHELRAAGLRVIVMTTLSQRNYKSAAALCALAKEMKLRGVIFERFVPLGRGAAQMRDSTVSPAQWRETLGAIADVAGVAPAELLPYKAFWVNGRTVKCAACCLGPESMALMPDGVVYPCRRVPTPVGKLPDDGMERILAALGAYASTPERCFDFKCAQTPS